MAKDKVYEEAAQKAGWGPSKSARERSGMRVDKGTKHIKRENTPNDGHEHDWISLRSRGGHMDKMTTCMKCGKKGVNPGYTGGIPGMQWEDDKD